MDETAEEPSPPSEDVESTPRPMVQNQIEEVQVNGSQGFVSSPPSETLTATPKTTADTAVVTGNGGSHLDDSQRQDIMLQLFQMAASTGRGEFASNGKKEQVMAAILGLESCNPTVEPTKSKEIYGTWELVYQQYSIVPILPLLHGGSGPFVRLPSTAQQYDWFCDMHRAALAISQIGTVRHIISPTRLVSEFEIKAGAVPFLNDLTPFSYSGGLPVRSLVLV